MGRTLVAAPNTSLVTTLRMISCVKHSIAHRHDMISLMKFFDGVEFGEIAKTAGVRGKLARELRFAPEQIADWDEREFIHIADRTGNKGVLVIELDDVRYAAPYELTRRVTDKATGRSKPITCDLCYTWRGGGDGARIRFIRASDKHSITLLCCGDLACSAHVRGKTAAAKISRANLREDMTSEQRVERLESKLSGLVELLGLEPLAPTEASTE